MHHHSVTTPAPSNFSTLGAGGGWWGDSRGQLRSQCNDIGGLLHAASKHMVHKFEAKLLQATVDAGSPAALFAASTSYFTFLTAKQVSEGSCVAGRVIHNATGPGGQPLTKADAAQLSMELCWALTEPVWQEALATGAVATADMSLHAMEVAAANTYGCDFTPDAACAALPLYTTSAPHATATTAPSPSSRQTCVNSIHTSGHSLSLKQQGPPCATNAPSFVSTGILPHGPPWQPPAARGSAFEHHPPPGTVSSGTPGAPYATPAAAAALPARSQGAAVAASIAAALAEGIAVRRAGTVATAPVQQQHTTGLAGYKRSRSCMDLGCHACEQRHGQQQLQYQHQQRQQQQCHQTPLSLCC